MSTPTATTSTAAADVDLSTSIGSLRLPAPTMTASGCAAAGAELAPYLDLSELGAVVTKSVMRRARSGRATPRMAETPSGMLNSIGLQGGGVDALVEHDLPWLAAAGATAVVSVAGGDPDLPALLGTIAELVLGTALRCVALGCVPELHGQNALLLCRDGAPRRLVLRDHDTVRTAPDWLARSGLEIPPYLVTDPVRNSLLLRRPEELLAYAQTLAVDVALRAVAEAFAGAGRGFDLGEARSILAGICERVLAEAPMPAERRSLLSGLLLESEAAPFKQVLTPLLAEGQAGTSMPSRLGTAPNPLFVRGLR